MTDPTEIALTVRDACVQAALDGYEQAQIAGLCQEGAWECAVDAMRMLDIKTILETTAGQATIPTPRRGPASA